MLTVLRTNYIRLAVLVAVMMAFSGSFASAQSNLQNTTTNVQSETGQTQTSANTQNQIGTLQQNNGQSVLTQSGVKPLGVVSDPKDAAPQSVVQPSTALKTDVSSSTKSSNMRHVIWALIGATIVMGIATLVTSSKSSVQQVVPAVTSPPSNIQLANSPKQKKQTRKQRKKRPAQLK